MYFGQHSMFMYVPSRPMRATCSSTDLSHVLFTRYSYASIILHGVYTGCKGPLQRNIQRNIAKFCNSNVCEHVPKLGNVAIITLVAAVVVVLLLVVVVVVVVVTVVVE